MGEFNEVEDGRGEVDFVACPIELVEFILCCIAATKTLVRANENKRGGSGRRRWRFEGEGTAAGAAHSAEILVYDEFFPVGIDPAIGNDDDIQRRRE